MKKKSLTHDLFFSEVGILTIYYFICAWMMAHFIEFSSINGLPEGGMNFIIIMIANFYITLRLIVRFIVKIKARRTDEEKER